MNSEDVWDVKRIRTRCGCEWGRRPFCRFGIIYPEITSIVKSANHAIEERVKFQMMDQEPGILIDVDDPATCDTVVCPLLTTTGCHAGRLEKCPGGRAGGYEKSSCCREMRWNESVERCIVHYEDTLLAMVDANII
eukprot:CAMPEP_0204619644 /NCGR_PEP_ID=MMETSP0717-20131115/5947_1 /ASSEMBLY_ACC=CAM_ASM_000666 /TAXON_ID=230516 /ORGANISM="Chaetoceros curvisetus" /LENGTH=135 /DNA_ID=CAMNT_0051633675 /DNA_START=368 /DNA_END=775 /DNA_ORIENTATION=+